MRMSIPGGMAACAIVTAVPLLSVALLSTPAFAAKQGAVLAACKRTPGCWVMKGYGVGPMVGCSPHSCFTCDKGNCPPAIKATGGSRFQRGPNAVVTPTKSSRGSIPIQTGPNVAINQAPTRSGSPCTVHCGPLGGRKK
jgi:hypothetical protein